MPPLGKRSSVMARACIARLDASRPSRLPVVVQKSELQIYADGACPLSFSICRSITKSSSAPIPLQGLTVEPDEPARVQCAAGAFHQTAQDPASDPSHWRMETPNACGMLLRNLPAERALTLYRAVLRLGDRRFQKGEQARWRPEELAKRRAGFDGEGAWSGCGIFISVGRRITWTIWRCIIWMALNALWFMRAGNK